MKTVKSSLNSFNKIMYVLIAILAVVFSFVFYKTKTNAYADTTYTVSYNLTNAVVEDEANHQQAIAGLDFTVTLKPADGYVEVNRKSVVVTIAGETTDKFVFNDKTGVLTIQSAAIVGEINISASGSTYVSNYAVTATSSNGVVSSPSTIEKSENYTVSFEAKDGFILYSKPRTIKSGKVNLIDISEAYTFSRSEDKLSATLTVYEEYITDDITVAWNAQQIKVNKSALTNATLLEDVAITFGQDVTFTIVPNEHNTLPETIELYYSDSSSGEALAEGSFVYDNQTGVVTVQGQYVTDVIAVKATAPFKIATVTYNITNLTASKYSSYEINAATYTKAWGVYLTPDNNYRLSIDNITIKINGEVLDSAQYSLSSNNGLTIKANNIIGDVEIIASAQSIYIQIEYDLLHMEIQNAPTQHEYNTGWPTDTYLSFTGEAGYSEPNYKDNTCFKLFVDDVELAIDNGWTIYTTSKRLFINKATLQCSKIKIYAHAQPINYTISILTSENGNVDTNEASFTVETEQNPISAVNITPNVGYEFDCWNVVESSNSSYESSNIFIWQPGTVGNFTIKANFKPITYTITIDAGEHGTSESPMTEYTVEDKSIELPQIEVEPHYELTHWLVINASGNWNTEIYEYQQGKYGNITIQAQYQLINYTITLNPTNKGTLTGDTVIRYTYQTTEAPVIETPITTEGFEFTGWKITTADGSWQEGDYAWQANSHGNIVLTAEYEAKHYTITFVDGDHGTVSSYTVDYDTNMSTITMPTVTPDTHYVFDKWQVKVGDGSWQVGDTFVYAEGTYGNITVAPIYKEREYVITLKHDSKGTLSYNKYTYTYTQTEGPEMNWAHPYHEGYAFDHWEVVETVGTWVAGETYTWQTNSYGDVTLIARYRALSNRPYTVYHYYRFEDTDQYILAEDYTQTLYGTTWETITVNPIFIPGYQYNESEPLNDRTKTLVGDGSDTFSIYYKRGTFTITYNVTNITVREATVLNRTYDPYSTTYGTAFYVYLDPAAFHHIEASSITFSINGEQTQLSYDLTSTNRLYLAAGEITGDLEIFLNARPNAFDVTYELEGLSVVVPEPPDNPDDPIPDYYHASYGTQFRVYLVLEADSSEYTFPTMATTQVYISNRLITGGYSTSVSTGYIQVNAANVTGNIKIVASAAPREYTITYKGEGGDTVVKYNVLTDIKLVELQKTGYKWVSYSFNSTSSNARWTEKFGGNIEDLNVGTGLIGNVSLTPAFSPITYYINLNTDGKGNVSSQQVTYTIERTTAPTIPVVRSSSGYAFNKWEVTTASGSWSLGDYVWQNGSYGDITLTARYDVVVYEINFKDTAYATVNGSTITYTIEDTVAPQLPTVTVLTGYEHAGWRIFAQVAGNWGSGDYNWQPGRFGDITIEPKTNLKIYTITYEAGEHGSMETNTATYTIQTTTQPVGPAIKVDAGYYFNHWLITTASGSWDLGLFNWTNGNYGDITLTAQYSARNDVLYLTSYYLETLDGDYEEKLSYENVQMGTTGQFVQANIVPITGFVYYPEHQSNVAEGYISASEMLRLKCYFKRQVFNVLISPSNNAFGQVSETNLSGIKYETPIIVENNTITIGSYQIVATANQQTVDTVYTFGGWAGVDSGLITEDSAIIANFTSTPRLYTIIFKNANEVVLTLQLEYNQTPVYTGATPTRKGGKDYKNKFIGWGVEGSNKVLEELPQVKGDAVYVAQFEVENQSRMLIIILTSVGGGALLLSAILIIVIAVLRRKPKNPTKF